MNKFEQPPDVMEGGGHRVPVSDQLMSGGGGLGRWGSCTMRVNASWVMVTWGPLPLPATSLANGKKLLICFVE